MAAQVNRDDPIVSGKDLDLWAPHFKIEWETMDQQQRGTTAMIFNI
jgi:hypothetical protein